MIPQRIQRKRTKGYRMPPNTVSVTRPGPYGNPFIVGIDGDARECVETFRHDLKVKLGADIMGIRIRAQLDSLRGKNVACFCREDALFCHGDVWLELANAPVSA